MPKELVEEVTEETTEASVEEQSTEETTEAPVEEQSTEETQEVEDQTVEIPDWAREQISKANKEAAGYRTRLRAAEKALEERKSVDEVQEAIAEATRQVTRELNIEKASKGLPDELRPMLQGETLEELQASANLLLTYINVADPSVTRGGGMNPTSIEDSSSSEPGSLGRAYGRWSN